MKTIDRYVLRSFIRPFFITFIVMVIFLLLQFVWKYIDDLVGRGVEWYYIAELLFYTSATVVPMALPLAVLISSIMTMGSMGEHSEMAAFKASGISLFRIMRPLFIFMFCVTVSAFLFSNYVIPVAKFESRTLLRNITDKKPALNIRAGVFYTGIEGYSIKVGEKYGPNQNKLKNVYIYDHLQGRGNSKVITAEEGEMYLTEFKRYLTIDLYNGSSYEDIVPAQPKARDNYPFVHSSFEKNSIKFDLSTFYEGDMKEGTRQDFTMLNVRQLKEGSDSLVTAFSDRQTEFSTGMKQKFSFPSLDSIIPQPAQTVQQEHLLTTIYPNKRLRTVKNALRLARAHQAYYQNTEKEFGWRQMYIRRYKLERIKKFSVSFAVLVLFFVGSPLGAIIRKGGLGMPIIVSIVIFLVYHISSYSFEKLGRAMIWTEFQAMWTANLVLLPIGLFLTYKSGTDSIIFNIELYLKPFKKLGGFIAKVFKKSEA